MSHNGPGQRARLFNTDEAVLEAREVRKDLPCTVTPVKPVLGFDLKFHGGYEVTIPLKELAGREDLLTTVFRVTPADKPGDSVYLSHKISVPAIEEDAKGDAFLHGSFDVGEGKYQIDWLIRDRSERVCSFNWEAEAELPQRDKSLAMTLERNQVAAPERDRFRQEPPVDRETGEGPLNVKVMVNFAPQNSRSAMLQPLDTAALLSILRSIHREPRIGKFSVVAFNMHEQRVIYRQDSAEEINFPALGEALETLKLGTIDLKRLGQKHGDTEFLTGLISQEMSGEQRPDAMIIAGPKVMLDENVPEETLKAVGEPNFPVFYLNYNLNPAANPWRDAIGNAVKFFKGVEITISRPRDVWYAWTDVMSRIVKWKVGRNSLAAATQ